MKKQRGQIVTDKILDAAERLFYSQGYSNTGINQVIEESDIAKGSLYKHFQSKSDLLLAYLQRAHRRWLDRLELAINAESDPKKKLLLVFDYHIERQELRNHGGCPFIKANDEAGGSEPLALVEIQQTKKNLKKLIKKLVIDSGHKKILSDDELTETIFLMVEGAVVEASIFKQTNDLRSAKQIIKKLI